MRSANGRRPPDNSRTTPERGSPSYSAEDRETVERRLRLLARIIARAYLRRQESRSETEPETSKDGEDAGE